MSNFSQQVISLAQQTQEKYGVPASVTLAQYALESGYGTSGLANRANNYFGISGTNNGKYVMSNGRKWRQYDSMAESFDDHGQLLSSGRYATATRNASTASQYVDAIAEIYAPSSDGNSNYAGKLKQIIRDNNLTQYDTSIGGRGGGFNGSAVSSTVGYTPVGYVKDKALDALGVVIKVIVYCILLVLAFVFFTQAFNINPKKAAVDTAKEETET